MYSAVYISCEIPIRYLYQSIYLWKPIHIYIYIYIYIYICVCVCVCVYEYIYIRLFRSIYLSIYPSLLKSIYLSIYPFTCISLSLSLYIYIYVCVCVCVCVCVFILFPLLSLSYQAPTSLCHFLKLLPTLSLSWSRHFTNKWKWLIALSAQGTLESLLKPTIYQKSHSKWPERFWRR